MLATFNQLQPIGELPDNYFLVIILGFLGGGFLVLIVGLSYLYFKQKNTDSFSESKKETLTYKEAISALNALGQVHGFLNEVMVLAPQKEEEIS